MTSGNNEVENPFPWKVIFAKTALARALSEYYPDVVVESIELPASLDEMDPVKDETRVAQTVRAENCVRVPLQFKDSKGRPFVGTLQVAVCTEGGELTLRVEGQPANFKVLNEPLS